ncbi:hypothetical protein [Flammeovirga pacifica]|uniref:Uncharacterized protein n=1 Tax=Flammeovirga pacifica TaxID=915059 RepID=A0A1S1Z258_FLAPC|nr:hypothetical protein [Flammeovirga pacifica]OHX67356.1 hypothetical protein NH26_13895 [Flammeovirga pacifica]
MEQFDIWEATELIDHITTYMSEELYNLVPGEVRSWESLAEANNTMRDMSITINRLLQFVSISKKEKGVEPLDYKDYASCVTAIGDKNDHLKEAVLNKYYSCLNRLKNEYINNEEHDKSLGLDYSENIESLCNQMGDVENQLDQL